MVPNLAHQSSASASHVQTLLSWIGRRSPTRIVDFVRSRGSVHYAKAAVPGEFAAWRRKIREAARAGGLSVSIIRTNDFVVIESGDYEVSVDEDLATADVIDAAIAGRALSFVDALHARRRERLRVV